MTTELLRLLHRLALPAARLVWRDYRVFGIAFWSVEGPEWSDGVDDALAADVLGTPYLKVVSSANDKHVYELSDAGREALKEAEDEVGNQTHS